MKKVLKFIFNFQPKEVFYRGSLKWYQVLVRKLARGTRNATIITLFVLTGYVSAKVYNWYNPVVKTVLAERQVVVEATTTAPVLQRIMSCESTGDAKAKATQIAKNGQINYHVNSDGTIDLGIGQINSVNFALATKLGYDLTKEADNIAFAKWLYANRGTDPWNSSKSCWSR